eukprot:TRINITY_DN42650_c0_g1_i1.p1 TRINITY_DN42650_c0_g1~~TRINITY_DN42650_c0_g1_i1.p1  ORF type:complete len:262 (-),score=50.20 TRINITY_DN42650_c0_g1_i1:23-757(-)
MPHEAREQSNYTLLASPAGSPTLQAPVWKIIYLVRHAESMENVRVRAFDRACRDLRQRHAPACQDVCSALQLVCFDVDAPLSSFGESQLEDVKAQLEQSDFFAEADLQLVVYSSRSRAVRTCNVLFGNLDRVPRKAMPEIIERTPYEALWSNEQFEQRVHFFKEWLSTSPEQRIAIVGHCQFFAKLLGKSCRQRYLGNVEVKRCCFDTNSLAFSQVLPLFSPLVEQSSEESCSGTSSAILETQQ